MAKHSDETRTTFLNALHTLVKNANIVFQSFREDCEHRTGVGCDHDDYHKDFALANICKLEDCPMMGKGI